MKILNIASKINNRYNFDDVPNLSRVTEGFLKQFPDINIIHIYSMVLLTQDFVPII